MNDQQSFSPGLLYSVAPENISSLHLVDEDRHEEFDWLAYQGWFGRYRIVQLLRRLLKSGDAS